MEQNRISALLSRQGKTHFREILGAVLFLAWPAIVEQIMLTAVQYVDTAMVGRLGADSTAAVGLTASTTWLFNGVFGAAATGFSVQVAQYLGAGQSKQAKRVAAQSLRFVVLFGILVAALAVGLSFPLPYWLGAKGEVAEMAGIYFRIIAIGMPFTLGVNMVSAILRCSGDTKSPMILNTSINLINMVLNFLLIYPSRTMTLWGHSFWMPGAGLGVAGAAIASITAIALICGVFLLVLFGKKGPVQLSVHESRRFDSTCLRTVFRLGTPIALERITMCGAQILITAVISGIGTVAIAANHLAVTAESLSYSPAFGVSVAATTLVGQAIGAGRKDLAMRFARVTTGIGVAIMTLGGVCLFVFARPLISIFSTDPQVIDLGMQVLRIVAFAEPLFGASIVAGGALRGAGDSRGPFLLSLGTMWGVRIVLSLLLAAPFGLIGVWIAMAVELIVRGSVFLIRLCAGRWLHIDLLKMGKTESTAAKDETGV